ncbi:hypothetical protein MJG53_003820 [Ovis ammon polii x Ovis aries]|uniref:Uncharacterized protein n=1 Tax=Ovis ammon polii x Ovis aries TaxID=2918886 RepID=A0ACB9V8I2_9CETA|nr:hypothetical protein MJG53_003820 [Ovis ammon polii x Ovis aries]
MLPRFWTRAPHAPLSHGPTSYSVSPAAAEALQGRVKENIFLTAAVSFGKAHHTIPVAVEILEASTQVQQVFHANCSGSRCVCLALLPGPKAPNLAKAWTAAERGQQSRASGHNPPKRRTSVRCPGASWDPPPLLSLLRLATSPSECKLCALIGQKACDIASCTLTDIGCEMHDGFSRQRSAVLLVQQAQNSGALVHLLTNRRHPRPPRSWPGVHTGCLRGAASHSSRERSSIRKDAGPSLDSKSPGGEPVIGPRAQNTLQTDKTQTQTGVFQGEALTHFRVKTEQPPLQASGHNAVSGDFTQGCRCLSKFTRKLLP